MTAPRFPDLLLPAERLHPLATAAPVQLLVYRLDAFCAADFAAIYDSYHPEAPFLRVHPNRNEYLAFAEGLKEDYAIAMCRVLDLDERGESASIVVEMQVIFRGEGQEYLELCRLRRTSGGWTYHSGLKRPRTDFPEVLGRITPDDFSGLDERLAI